MFEIASSSASDVSFHFSVGSSLYFQHTIGTTITIPGISLSTKDVSCLKLQLKAWHNLRDVLHCSVSSRRDFVRHSRLCGCYMLYALCINMMKRFSSCDQLNTAQSLGMRVKALVYTCLTSVVYLDWPPLWSSGQISWLQIQRSGFNSRSYQILWEVVGLERGSLSLVYGIVATPL
jgi:hypothetical protein